MHRQHAQGVAVHQVLKQSTSSVTQSEMVLPLQAEMVLPLQAEMVLPLQSEMVLPLQSEMVLPLQSETGQSQMIPDIDHSIMIIFFLILLF